MKKIVQAFKYCFVGKILLVKSTFNVNPKPRVKNFCTAYNFLIHFFEWCSQQKKYRSVVILEDGAASACVKTRILNPNHGATSHQVSNFGNGHDSEFLANALTPTEVLFSNKRDKVSHPPLTFKNNRIHQTLSQKRLGLVLNSKLGFNQHIDDKINICNKIIGIMKRLSMNLFRNILLTKYESFVRSLLVYADVSI